MGQNGKAQSPAEWGVATGGAGWDAVRDGSTWKGELIYFFFLGILTSFLTSLWVAGKDSPV